MIRSVNVISLDRTPERFTRFVERHPGLPVERVAAVDGLTLDRGALIGDGILRPENTWRMGALGCAMSHVRLWRRCAEGTDPIHVAEDDVLLREDFLTAAAAVLASLPAWDVVLWGHNFDWPVQIRPAAGLGVVIVQYDHQTLDPAAFRTPGPSPAALRLISATGTGCYSVSPAGAARMLRDCLPFGAEAAVYLDKHPIALTNTGIDIEMCRHYADWRAFVAFPALAASDNDQTRSTIRGHLGAIHDPRVANRAVT